VWYGFSGQVAYLNAPDVPMAVQGWLASAALCPIVMSAGLTMIGTAAAHDVNVGYIVRFK